jgi:phosphoribosylaminoimidazole (AIR) synthetase
MLVVVPAAQADAALATLIAVGEPAWRIGEMIPRDGGPPVRFT